MLTASVGLTHVRGDTLVLEFLVTDEAGAVADITGTTPMFALSELREEIPAVESPDNATATITSAAGGTFRVTVAASVTDDLSGLWVYQARLDDLSGNRQTVSRGTILFVDQVII